MKLSRRGKSVRRRRHTKRVGKHLRYKGKKVRASKRYHRGIGGRGHTKKTHRKTYGGRVKRGGVGVGGGFWSNPTTEKLDEMYRIATVTSPEEFTSNLSIQQTMDYKRMVEVILACYPFQIPGYDTSQSHPRIITLRCKKHDSPFSKAYEYNCYITYRKDNSFLDDPFVRVSFQRRDKHGTDNADVNIQGRLSSVTTRLLDVTDLTADIYGKEVNYNFDFPKNKEYFKVISKTIEANATRAKELLNAPFSRIVEPAVNPDSNSDSAASD
jgi:hypothetical protein